MKVGDSPVRSFGQITLLVLGFVVSSSAGPKLDTSDPLSFFTNLASRLLQSELNLSLTRIQIYPTNQYTPAVHRLLQVTANILDAATNRFNTNYPYLPSVFRPLFTNDNGSIFICGYEEAGTNALTNAWRDLTISTDRAALQANDYVYGIPVVIGAKKGSPNFNEFAMQSVFQITRKLEVTRASLSAPQSAWKTNQMFVIGISNVIGVEAWNSYRSNYSRAVDIIVANALTMVLTNDSGLVLSQQTALTALLSVPATGPEQWKAYYPGTTNSFLIPLRTNFVFLPTAAYLFNPPGFTTNLTAAWDTSQSFQQRQWGLAITNRLRFLMVDRETQRLVDFVTLEGLNGIRNLSEEIRDPDNAQGFGALWSTNLMFGTTLPQGILNQILISFGLNAGSTTDWKPYDLGSHSTKDFEIDYFRALYGLAPLRYPFLVNTSLVQQVPFTPTKRVQQHLSWQANDPLVHYTPDDLVDLKTAGSLIKGLVTGPPINNIGRLNTRYEPWGGNPESGLIDPTRDFSVALKDPLICESDNWSFPDAEPLSLAMLGRVHRGTPWQTVYLKSAGIDLATWTNWTGISDVRAALLTTPTNDWRIAGLLASLLNTNSPRQLLSINERNTNTRLAAQDGLIVLSNSLTDAQLNFSLPQFDTMTVSSNSPQAAIIADAVAFGRANQPSQRFHALGDILAVPELSTNSPWLNLNSAIQLQRGISDEAYERIPVQLLARLRPDSIGSLFQTGGASHIQFTGFDDFPYTVEVSSNLLDWVSVSTNYPTNGVFDFIESAAAGNDRRFYRSVLLP